MADEAQQNPDQPDQPADITAEGDLLSQAAAGHPIARAILEASAALSGKSVDDFVAEAQAAGAHFGPLVGGGSSTLFHSTGFANGILGGTVTPKAAFDGGNLKLYSGTAPVNGDAAEGTLLCTVPLPNPLFGAAAAKTLTANAITAATIAAAGTCTHWRLVQPSDTGASSTTQVRLQGSYGTSGADINGSSTNFLVGGSYTQNSLTYAIT